MGLLIYLTLFYFPEQRSKPIVTGIIGGPIFLIYAGYLLSFLRTKMINLNIIHIGGKFE
jgi:hypothetical protein